MDGRNFLPYGSQQLKSTLYLKISICLIKPLNKATIQYSSSSSGKSCYYSLLTDKQFDVHVTCALKQFSPCQTLLRVTSSLVFPFPFSFWHVPFPLYTSPAALQSTAVVYTVQPVYCPPSRLRIY